MKIVHRRVLAITAAALLITVVAVYLTREVGLLDRQFVFFPERELAQTPANLGVEYEDVFLHTSDDVRIHGWYVPSEGDTTLVWFHGNAGNIGRCVDNLALMHQNLGVDIFIFDYRGYGKSEGTISEQGSYIDAEAAVGYVRSRHDGRLILFGRSLGAAVAVEMAARYRVDGVILESPFTSISGMARRTYPLLPTPIINKIVQSRYDSIGKIGRVESPLMVLHGDRDEIVPIEEGRRLFDAAREPKRFFTIRGAGHNDTYMLGEKSYLEALKRFIENPATEEK